MSEWRWLLLGLGLGALAAWGWLLWTEEDRHARWHTPGL